MGGKNEFIWFKNLIMWANRSKYKFLLINIGLDLILTDIVTLKTV